MRFVQLTSPDLVSSDHRLLQTAAPISNAFEFFPAHTWCDQFFPGLFALFVLYLLIHTCIITCCSQTGN